MDFRMGHFSWPGAEPGAGFCCSPNIKRTRAKFGNRMEMGGERLSGGRRMSTDHQLMAVEGLATERKMLEIWERKCFDEWDRG
jgi:hypothetical protein